MENSTPEERRAIAHILALVETVRDFPEGAPSGICYMAFQMQGIGLTDYQGYVDAAVRAKLIRVSGHVLYPL